MPGFLRLLTGLEGKAEVDDSQIKVYLPSNIEVVDGKEVVCQTMYGFREKEISAHELRDRSLAELSEEYEELVRQYGLGFMNFVEPDPQYRQVRVWGELAGGVNLVNEAFEFEQSMDEFERLSSRSDWIDLDFIERERTPREIIEVGIQLHVAVLSFSNTK